MNNLLFLFLHFALYLKFLTKYLKVKLINFLLNLKCDF